MHIPLHCYCTVHMSPKLVHIYLKNLVSDTDSYKVKGINVKKYGCQWEAKSCND